MPSIINSDNGAVSGSAGLKQSADSTGVLALQTNGTTAVSISTSQVVTLTQPLPVASGGTGAITASAARTSLGLVIGTDVLAPSGSGASLTALNASNISTGTLAAARLPAGSIVQVATSTTGALATGTTTIPFDDTIPQITEGTEFMTLAITPSSATNTLIIQVTLQIAFSGSDWTTVALFKDSTANALATTTSNINSGFGLPQTFNYKMTAGTTSSTTFRVRAGAGSAGTITVNGTASARRFGGVMASTMTIYEVAV